jgi:hypothetical protein
MGRQRSRWLKGGIALVAIAAAVGLLLMLAGRTLSGQWLGPGSLLRMGVNVARAVNAQRDVTHFSRGGATNVVFLHHSTGALLIEQGDLRARLTQAGFDLWDQGYNAYGLRNPAGQWTGYGYSVPGDNTDPDGLARIFAQPVFPLPVNTLSALLQHEVIVIKSCFAPANNIRSEEQLESYKTMYLQMRQTMARYPNKLFIVMTSPPLNPAETTLEEAARARALAQWLQTDTFRAGHANIAVFDLYDALAEDNPAAADANMLRAAYREGGDSHPSRAGSQAIAPLFADFLTRAVATYRQAQASLP